MREKILSKDFKVRTFNTLRGWEKWWVNIYLSTHWLNTSAYTLDWHKIEAACSKLGLLDIPKVTLSDGINMGHTTYWENAPATITLHTRLRPIVADICLWHELTHCLQHQERGNTFLPIGMQINPDVLGWDGYWNHETERGARENEPYGLEFPLVKGINDE